MKKLATVVTLFTVLTVVSSAVAAEPSREAYGRFFNHLIGKWQIKADGGMTIISDFRWVGEKAYLLCEGKTDNGTAIAHILGGYDANAKRWNRQVFFADGVQATIHITLSPEQLNKEPKTATYTGVFRSVNADGKVREGKVTYTLKSPTEWTVDDGTNLTTVTRVE